MVEITYVATRTEDRPEPDVTSQRMACSACNEDVWVQTGLYTALKGRLGAVAVLCDHCVTEEAA
jgi:hypothetical protein